LLDQVAERERAKYERVWTGSAYRRWAWPCEEDARQMVARFGAQPGQTVIDYGSGQCRAMKMFRQAGLEPLGIDIAENAMPEGAPFTVIQATLWDLPEGLGPSDYCFCRDVIEHLPEDKVDQALAGIAARTRIGGFIQPGLTLDRCGPLLIGEPLHLTVKPAEWWIERLGRHFDVEDAGRTRNDFQAKLYVRAKADVFVFVSSFEDEKRNTVPCETECETRKQA